MKITTILSVITLLSISFTSCTKETLEVIDPAEAKIIGQWKHIHSKQWQSYDDFNIIGEMTSQEDDIIEIKKGDFTLIGDQLNYRDQTFTVKFLVDTMWWNQPNREYRYERVR